MSHTVQQQHPFNGHLSGKSLGELVLER